MTTIASYVPAISLVRRAAAGADRLGWASWAREDAHRRALRRAAKRWGLDADVLEGLALLGPDVEDLSDEDAERVAGLVATLRAHGEWAHGHDYGRVAREWLQAGHADDAGDWLEAGEWDPRRIADFEQPSDIIGRDDAGEPVRLWSDSLTADEADEAAHPRALVAALRRACSVRPVGACGRALVALTALALVLDGESAEDAIVSVHVLCRRGKLVRAAAEELHAVEAILVHDDEPTAVARHLVRASRRASGLTRDTYLAGARMADEDEAMRELARLGGVS